MTLYYLNNTGSRWVVSGAKAVLIVKQDDYQKVRTIKSFEAFGNFTVYVFTYRGKQIKCLPEDFERINGLPVCYYSY
jgi:hypothetical protein